MRKKNMNDYGHIEIKRYSIKIEPEKSPAQTI